MAISIGVTAICLLYAALAYHCGFRFIKTGEYRTNFMAYLNVVRESFYDSSMTRFARLRVIVCLIVIFPYPLIGLKP